MNQDPPEFDDEDEDLADESVPYPALGALGQLLAAVVVALVLGLIVLGASALVSWILGS